MSQSVKRIVGRKQKQPCNKIGKQAHGEQVPTLSAPAARCWHLHEVRPTPLGNGVQAHS